MWVSIFVVKYSTYVYLCVYERTANICCRQVAEWFCRCMSMWVHVTERTERKTHERSTFAQSWQNDDHLRCVPLQNYILTLAGLRYTCSKKVTKICYLNLHKTWCSQLKENKDKFGVLVPRFHQYLRQKNKLSINNVTFSHSLCLRQAVKHADTYTWKNETHTHTRIRTMLPNLSGELI